MVSREGASPADRWKWNETIGPVENRPGRQGMSPTKSFLIKTNRNKAIGAIPIPMPSVKLLFLFPTQQLTIFRPHGIPPMVRRHVPNAHPGNLVWTFSRRRHNLRHSPNPLRSRCPQRTRIPPRLNLNHLRRSPRLLRPHSTLRRHASRNRQRRQPLLGLLNLRLPLHSLLQRHPRRLPLHPNHRLHNLRLMPT
jgi:hypothetical protein